MATTFLKSQDPLFAVGGRQKPCGQKPHDAQSQMIMKSMTTMESLIIEVSGIIALAGKKTVKLIIALVGNVSNNSIGWISTICIMN